MAVNPSPFGPKPQFEIAAGTPAVGNKLYFYVAGSVGTKQNTYTSSTGLVANTNPVILDSLGFPTTTEIWFTAGQTYKVVYAPSTDTDPPTSAIWTIDNLSGINDVSSTASEWQAGPTPTYVSATSFTLTGDQTSIYAKGRRVKCTVTAGTVYGTIVTTAFAALTTVTVALDSGALDSGLSAASYGLVAPVNPSIGADMVYRKGTAVASAATTDIWSIAGDFVHITGSTGPITSFGTAPYAGSERTVIVDSTPTITHNATTLQCPGGANIVCAAGDRFVVRADTTANAIITDFIRAGIAPLTATQSANQFYAGPASGAAAAPTFRATVGADGASLVLLDSKTASASASLDFTTGIGSTYDAYELHLVDLLPATAGAALSIRVSEDAGATYKAGAADYRVALSSLNGAATAGTTTGALNAIQLTSGANGQRNASAGLSGVIRFYKPSGAVASKNFVGQTVCEEATTTEILRTEVSGRYQLTNNAINAIRLIYLAAGNITSGSAYLYGVRKA